MMPPRIPFWEKRRGFGPCMTWWGRFLASYRADDGKPGPAEPVRRQQTMPEEIRRRLEERQRSRSYRIVRRRLPPQRPWAFSYTEGAKDTVTWIRYWESRIAPTSTLADFTREWTEKGPRLG